MCLFTETVGLQVKTLTFFQQANPENGMFTNKFSFIQYFNFTMLFFYALSGNAGTYKLLSEIPGTNLNNESTCNLHVLLAYNSWTCTLYQRKSFMNQIARKGSQKNYEKHWGHNLHGLQLNDYWAYLTELVSLQIHCTHCQVIGTMQDLHLKPIQELIEL